MGTYPLVFAYLITVFSAELTAIPAQAIARKKELLFSDDFAGEELRKAWAIVVPTFSVEKGTLV